MKVIVPSLGRAGTSTSMRWLEGCGLPVHLAVHSDERDAYKRAYPWAKVEILPESTRRHAGKLRRHIIQNEKDPFFFVDDDILPRLVHVKTHAEMFRKLEKHLEKAPMSAIGKQIFSNGVIPRCKPMNGDKLAIRNQFASTVYGLVPQAFAKCPLENLQVYEDCALVIHAIQNGGTIVSYSATHTNKSPAEGGCNSWRTADVVLQSLDELVRLYPGICRKIETRHTAHGHALGVGVRVAWSRIAP